MSLSRLTQLKTTALALSVLAFMPLAAQAEDFTADQKKQIETIIGDYLKSNPEAVVKALEAYQMQQTEADEKKVTDFIKENKETIAAASLPSVGKADATVTVVEFFDYNCGYCKRALEDIQAIVKENADVRFVFHEMPILGPTSGVAAQYALAAHKQGKYFDYHVAVMHDRGSKDEESLLKLAKDVGLDTEKLKQDANSDAIKQELGASMIMADKLGVHGTPAFIIEDKLYKGYLGKEALVGEIKKIADAKKAAAAAEKPKSE